MVVGAAAAGIGAGGAGVLVVGCGVFCNAAGFEDGCAGAVLAGEGDAGAVVCCAIVLNPSSREAVSVHFQVRMTKSSLSRLIRQLENHMHNRSRIDRLIVMLGRLEPDLVGSRDRSLVQAVTHSPHNAIHVQLPVCSEKYFQ